MVIALECYFLGAMTVVVILLARHLWQLVRQEWR
jgi:hypothetical protein